MNELKGLMVNRWLRRGGVLVVGGGAVWVTLVLSGCASVDSQQGSSAPHPHEQHLHAQAWQGWHVHLLPGKRPTHYKLDQHEGRSVVLATSERAVSLFRKNERIEPEQLGALHFSWKVPQLISGADLAQRDKADSPARLVLAFEGDRSTFSMKNSMLSELSQALTGEPMPYATLMYVWSNRHPVESVIANPRTERIQKIVVESGPTQLKRWLEYERDVLADFQKAFGEAPGALLAIGLMTDSDNTQSTTRAWYGDIRLSRP